MPAHLRSMRRGVTGAGGRDMLCGYVSDERYLALEGVAVEFEQAGTFRGTARSTASGAIHAELPPGEYQVTLARDGYGPKRVTVYLGGAPYQFRLLADRLLGYMWPKWVCAGETAEFRVHSPVAYRLSLWRYGGRKEQVRLLGWFDEHGPRATAQLTPDGDFTQTGVQWNRTGWGSSHHQQRVAAPERSGLYYLHAEGENGEFFSFPWVVAPARPTAPLAVLASTNTWNAYNNFGGRSNYACSTGLPPRPIVYARQDLVRYQGGSFNEWQFPDEDYLPVSFDRPEPCNHIPAGTEPDDPITGRQGCHLAPAEWRLLAWLERQGFAYDLYSDSQLDEGVLDLDSYRALLVSTHPEYWSRRMYDRVKEWVFRRGGRLAYLGGNGLNCEVEYVGDDRSAMRCRNQLLSAGEGSMRVLRPDRPGEYAESRFDRVYESEARLLGVVCTEAGIMTAAPYRVVRPDHWVFAGCGLRAGDLFGAASLHERIPGGASGHETDKMSPSSPPDCVLLARGENPGNGGAHIVYHEPGTPGGPRGAVFSVGSITWPASILVDEHVGRITRNVLERFLAPPAGQTGVADGS